MKITNTNIQHFKGLSQFKDIKDFNTSNEKWLADHKRAFTYSEYLAIKRLIRFAGNAVLGVANACINTILKSIKKHDAEAVNGISRSTFKRAINKAIAIGMIKRYQGKRWNGSTTANVYVFEPYKANCSNIEPCPQKKVEQTQPQENEIAARVTKEIGIVYSLNHLKASKSIKANNINNNKTFRNVLSNDEVESILKVPFHELTLADKVKSLVTATIGQDKVKEVNRVIFSKVNRTLKLTTFKQHEGKVKEIVLDALKTSINALKQGKARNLFAYLNGVIERKLDALTFELLNDIDIDSEPVAVHGKLENWLLE